MRKQSDLLEINYLSHVSVGNELYVEMLTENCLLQQEANEPVHRGSRGTKQLTTKSRYTKTWNTKAL